MSKQGKHADSRRTLLLQETSNFDIVTLPTVMLLALFKGALIDNFAACKSSLRKSRNGFYVLRSEKSAAISTRVV